MPSRWLPSIFLSLALAATASAQDNSKQSDTPDLSGHWVLNAAKSKLRSGPFPRANEVEITVTKSAVTVQEEFNGQDTVFAFLTDGKAKPIARVEHGMIIGKARWRENTLVTEIWGDELPLTHVDPSRPGYPNAVERRSGLSTLHETHRWTVSPDGKVLTRTIDGGKEICVYHLKSDQDSGQSPSDKQP
jgi:hypothetical protein